MAASSFRCTDKGITQKLKAFKFQAILRQFKLSQASLMKNSDIIE